MKPSSELVPSLLAILVSSFPLELEAAPEQAETVAPEGIRYALCVGINRYTKPGRDTLTGCVNDAVYFQSNLVARSGGDVRWEKANTTLLTDDAATKEAIRDAIRAYAGKAVAGDIFVYQQSSHGNSQERYDADAGGLRPTTAASLCAYDDDYRDMELAEDLALFRSGVKVVVIIDACRSAGLFKGAAPKAPFHLAARVSAIMDANRSRQTRRGRKAATTGIGSSEIGWVTAADYDEDSMDYGGYDTDEWMTTYLESKVPGGALLASLTWGWWNGAADDDGDGDGFMDAYEGWRFARDVCTRLDVIFEETGCSHTPQFLNESVLRSVELGLSGNNNAFPLPTTYMVAFNANGGTGPETSQPITFGASTALWANSFEKSGYVFIGWAMSAKGAVAYTDQETVLNLAPVGGSVTLYAKWAKKSYKVKFYANGGKGKMAVETFTYGKAKKLSKNTFKRDGYTFKGWATSKKLAQKGKVSYKNKKKVKNLITTGKTVKLYAVWKRR